MDHSLSFPTSITRESQSPEKPSFYSFRPLDGELKGFCTFSPQLRLPQSYAGLWNFIGIQGDDMGCINNYNHMWIFPFTINTLKFNGVHGERES